MRWVFIIEIWYKLSPLDLKGTKAMKITIDVDCSPEEARQFLGLPDVAPLQASVMADIEKRTLAALAAMEPEQLMKTWMSAGLPGNMPSGLAGGLTGGLPGGMPGGFAEGMKGWEEMQKAFWQQMTAAAGGKDKQSDG